MVKRLGETDGCLVRVRYLNSSNSCYNGTLPQFSLGSSLVKREYINGVFPPEWLVVDLRCCWAIFA